MMGKMGKFLAAKKGKDSIKASAEAALQNLAIPESSSELKVLESLQTTKNARNANDDWGVDDSDEDAVNVVGGGRFNLLSENDVVKKQTNRQAKKWGQASNEEQQQPQQQQQAKVELPIVEVETAKEVVEPEEQKKEVPQKYVPKGRRTLGGGRGGQISSRLDIGDLSNFPDLSVSESASIAVSESVEKPVNLKKERKERVKKVDTTELNVEASNVIPVVKDLIKVSVPMSMNVQLNEAATRKKYVGRRKFAPVSLPAIEV